MESRRIVSVIQLPLSWLIVVRRMRQSSFHYILISILCPSIRHSLRRPNPVEEIVSRTRHDEPGEKVDTVDICCADRDGLANSASEPDHIDYNAQNIGRLILTEREGNT
jgi:hypothetical protein